MISEKPLKIERIKMIAAVPRAIPAELIAEITLMTLWDFFANRYLNAMNRSTLNYFFSRDSMCSA